MRVRTNKMSETENTSEDLYELMLKENVGGIKNTIIEERKKELERYKKTKEYQRKYKQTHKRIE